MFRCIDVLTCLFRSFHCKLASTERLLLPIDHNLSTRCYFASALSPLRCCCWNQASVLLLRNCLFSHKHARNSRFIAFLVPFCDCSSANSTVLFFDVQRGVDRARGFQQRHQLAQHQTHTRRHQVLIHSDSHVVIVAFLWSSVAVILCCVCLACFLKTLLFCLAFTALFVVQIFGKGCLATRQRAVSPLNNITTAQQRINHNTQPFAVLSILC